MSKETTLIHEALANSVKLQQALNKYSNVPRSYGTEDVLYMREVHLLELLGDQNAMMSAEEIAEKLDITHGAVTQLTNRLEKKGYVYRDKSTTDRRQILRGLTEKGQQIYKLHKEFDENQFNGIIQKCDAFSMEEFEIFNKVALHLTKCISEEQ